MGLKFFTQFIVLSGISLLLSATPALSSSGYSDGEIKQKQNRYEHRNAFKKLRKVTDAMGGIEKINAISGQRLIANGRRFEPEQSFTPGGEAIHLADYRYTLLQSFNARKFRTEWSADTRYPVIAQRNFTEIINLEHAAVIGVDNVFGIPQAAMQGTRMGTQSKQYFAASPLAIIKYALSHPDKLSYLGTRKRTGKKYKLFSISLWPQSAQLFIDAKTNRPALFETLEDDPVYGDTLWQIQYNDWQQVDGIWLPTQLIHTINGRMIHSVNFSSIELLNTIDNSEFDIPEELISPFDEKLFSWGTRSSQFFGRLLLSGIPFDLDQSSEASVNLVDIAPGVVHIQGITHNTLIVEMKDYLVAIDPPLYEQRTRTVLKAINQRWENKPIKYIVASHFHNDHIGGIRGYAAIGATLVVGSSTKEHYETLLASPHTVYPDALSLKPVEPRIIEVADDAAYFISDGERKIRIFDLVNRHAIGMLVPYIEDQKLAFVSDLYNPEVFPVPIPALFSFWSLDLLAGLEDSGLEIDRLVGAHGSVVSYERFVSDIEATF